VPTGAMSARRSGATATLLQDGEVLVAGGGSASAELYNPKTGAFKATAPMTTPRTDATATLLQDGEVLVAGGCCQLGNPYKSLTSAELYDPTTGTWSATGSLNVPRSGDTATLLQDGQVLVAGGYCSGTSYGCTAGSLLVNLKSAELYDPATGTWSLTGSMRAGRALQTATLLQNGEVLMAGGFHSCDTDFCTDLRTAELYDPVTGTWLPTGSMSAGREQQTATSLPDGDVLVAGGLNQGGTSGIARTYSSAELYDPVRRTWSPTGSMHQARAGQTASLLDGGWVLVTGGGTATSEIYEPEDGSWVPTGSLSVVRTDQTATALPDGDVLVAGGTGPDQEPLQTAEVYQTGPGPLVNLSTTALAFPSQEVGTTGDALSFTVTNMGTAPLHVAGVETTGLDPSDFEASTGCGKVAVGSGDSCAVLVRFSPVYQGLRTATVSLTDNAPLSPQGVRVSGYGAGPDVWVPTGSMSTGRSNFAMVPLRDGEVLVAGGEDHFGNTLATSELYDPLTASFSPTGSLTTSRELPAAVRLADGDVLVAGGYTEGEFSASVLSSAELYDPSTGTWSPTASMDVAGDGITATLLGDGDVLATGFPGSNPPELYDPTSGTWSLTEPLPTGGDYGLAVRLGDGTVLLTNGPKGASALYHPATGTWTSTGSMGMSHNGGTATLLRDGDVLVVGGVTDNGMPETSAQLYDPSSGTWSATAPLPGGRWDMSSVLLSNGDVLVAGGCTDNCTDDTENADSYVYADGFWGETGSLPTSRYGQSAALLTGGDVLLGGGYEDESAAATPTAEIYIPTLVSATPHEAAVGQSITVTGSGFYAHEVVVVSLSGPTYKVIARATTGAKGTFAVSPTVPDVPPGTYELEAEGQTSYAAATTSFVVEKGSG
jgi:N-acetylneuraminic acid mutarotase